MKANTRKAIDAFEHGKAKAVCESIWSSGDKLMSYQTVLLQRIDLDRPRLILNGTNYSPTTSTHQNAIASYYSGQIYKYVDDIPRGTSSLEWSQAAMGKEIEA